jgi:hypothetical protein
VTVSATPGTCSFVRAAQPAGVGAAVCASAAAPNISIITIVPAGARIFPPD